MEASQTQQFAATVTGTTNTAVTWSISPGVGTISAAGLYTAPSTVSNSRSVTVTATSAANAQSLGSATVNLVPTVTVAVSPASAALTASQTQQFTATVTGTSKTSVTWTLSPAAGTISKGGLYTAPASITASQTVTVTASSTVDSRKSASATVTLMPPVTVTIDPTSTTLPPGQSKKFTAKVSGTANTGVSWSLNPALGTLSTDGLYNAPSSVSSPQTTTITATSIADPTESGSASVVVTPPVTVALSPTSATLPTSQTQQFTATVSGTTNTAVSWSVNGVAGGNSTVGTVSSAGLYTAPAAVPSPNTVSVKATSVADTSQSATAAVTVVAPVSVSVSPTSASLGVNQTQQFTATVTGTANTAVTWSVNGVAGGNSTVGTVSSAGLYTAPAAVPSPNTATVTATSVADTSKSASATVTVTAPVVITTATLPDGTTGVLYSATLAATGGTPPYNWSILSGLLPAGLSLAITSGTISGTPTTAGSYNVTMQATDANGQQASKSLSLVVAAVLTITPTTLPDGTIGLPYSAALTALGGTAPLTWAVTSGQPPPGLSLSSSGSISGTPTTAGQFTFNVQVQDSTAQTGNQQYMVAVDSTATDQYGGLTALMSPGGKIGGWSVEKYPTADGKGRWLITTPAGHGLWCGAHFGIGKPTSLNVAAKYGSTLNWQTAALSRYTGWGFNCLAEYSDIGLITAMNAGSLGKRIPYFTGYAEHLVYDAVGRRNMIPGQVLPTDAVKDLNATAVKYTGWHAMMADGFDPNFAPYVSGFAAARVAQTGDPYADAERNPWNIAMSIEDADYTFGFGPGPDDFASADRVYHPHIGWIALASAPNLYIQWLDTVNVYNSLNWIFTEPNVYAKNDIVQFLKTRYNNNIGSLNSAWGSSYSAFDSARMRYTGETVGTTDGTQSQLQHTLAHAGVSATSLLVKVDGAPMGTDQAGNVVGRWPDGTTRLGGTINYSTGALTLTSRSHTNYNQNGPGTTSWGTVNLGRTNVVQQTLYLYLFPEECRISDDQFVGQWEVYNTTCPSSPYTVTGTVNYAAGTISNLTITPAIPADHYVQFQYDWTMPLPGIHTVTLDYDVNGFGVGTALADEDGSHTGWLGTTDGILRKSAVPAAVWQDLSDWLYNYSDSYYTNTIDAIRPYFPGKLIMGQMSGVGGHHGAPREQMAAALANHADILTFSQITQPLLDKLVAWGLGDKPIMDAWEGLGAQLDSPFSGVPWNNVASDNFSTQAARGTAYAARINQALTGRGSGGASYQTVGIKFWAYPDTTREGQNYGLVSPSDNAYDGSEATTGTHPCSAPLQSYTCGGEKTSYGDAVTAVRNVLSSIWQIIQ